MTARLTIDGAGRVVIPKPLRDELDLAPGDTLELETAGESITLRPARGRVPLTKEKGVWVYRTGQPLPLSVVDDLLRRIRTDRDQDNLGVAD
ncbi:MAG TPA: AbrB/MazE/SpoVT family DNA-binding domain-containing protein [Dongiaceae bacterium]|nr:AbrB/MazE/SpoVT family DNA-binding domain-containing protein [Dongiaceae bacterium]